MKTQPMLRCTENNRYSHFKNIISVESEYVNNNNNKLKRYIFLKGSYFKSLNQKDK